MKKRGRAFGAALVAGSLALAPVLAHEVILERVVTAPDDPMPDGQPGENFRALGSPALHGDDVAFLGLGTAGTSGVFCRCGGAIQKVLLRGEPVPGAPGIEVRFISLPPTVWSGEVVFFAEYLVNLELRSGAYVWKDGSLEVVADFMTPVPGGAPGELFVNIDDVSNDERGVVFRGSGDQGRRGIYRLRRADGQLEVVVDEDTVSPDGTLFIGGADPFTRDGVTVFAGGSALTGGYYTDSGGVFSLVVPVGMPLPGGLPGEVIVFVINGSPSTGSGSVGFQATGTMGSWGLYGDLNGLVDVIIDLNTINPLTGLPFESASNVVAIGSDWVAFEAGAPSLMKTLWLRSFDGSSMIPITTEGEELDGQLAIFNNINHASTSGNRVAFSSFRELDEVIYIASPRGPTVVEIPTASEFSLIALVLLLVAGAILVLRRPQNS